LGCTIAAFSTLPGPLRYSFCICVHFLPIWYLTLSFLFVLDISSNCYFYAQRIPNAVHT
jgi:hypothetical protein